MDDWSYISICCIFKYLKFFKKFKNLKFLKFNWNKIAIFEKINEIVLNN